MVQPYPFLLPVSGARDEITFCGYSTPDNAEASCELRVGLNESFLLGSGILIAFTENKKMEFFMRVVVAVFLALALSGLAVSFQV